MCCYTDGEYADVFDVTQPVARKQWCCDECGSKIEPGERYTRIAVLFDGSWSTHRNCMACWGAKLRAGKFGVPLFTQAMPELGECVLYSGPCSETVEAYAEFGASVGLMFALREQGAAL